MCDTDTYCCLSGSHAPTDHACDLCFGTWPQGRIHQYCYLGNMELAELHGV